MDLFAHQKFVMVAAVAFLIAIGITYYAFPDSGFAPSNPDIVACTKEARICPDGSAVGRVGPNCEFAPCPSEALCEGEECPKSIRDIDFQKKLSDEITASNYGIPCEVHVGIIYYDFDGDGHEDAFVGGSSCLTGTAGPDIYNVYKLKDGNLTQLLFDDSRLKEIQVPENAWLRGYSVRLDEENNLIKPLAIAYDNDGNCCPSGPRGVAYYVWNGSKFIISNIEGVLAEPNWASWKKFENKKYEFSLAYPGDWTDDPAKVQKFGLQAIDDVVLSEDVFSIVYKPELGSCFEGVGCFYPAQFSLQIAVNGVTQDFESYVKNYIEIWLKPAGILTIRKTNNINGFKIYEIVAEQNHERVLNSVSNITWIISMSYGYLVAEGWVGENLSSVEKETIIRQMRAIVSSLDFSRQLGLFLRVNHENS